MRLKAYKIILMSLFQTWHLLQILIEKDICNNLQIHKFQQIYLIPLFKWNQSLRYSL